MSETKSQPVRLRFEVQILLKHYSEAVAIASNANLTENDHRKVWVRFLVESLQGGFMLSNNDIVFQRLITDLNQSSGKNFDFYLALIMNMLNTDESLSRFLTEQSLPRESEELRSVWLRWMPMIFQFCSQLPVKFLTLLMRSNPIRFRLIYQQLVHHRGLKEGMKSDDLMESLKQQKEERVMREYDLAFSWLRSSERDLDRFDRVVHAHYVLYEWLSTGKRPGLLDRISDMTGSTFEQLEEFCATNPPYFRTKQLLTGYKTISGLPFPAYGQMIASMTLDANGLREARLHVIWMRGDSRTFHLVSPYIYRFSIREQLFVHALGQLLSGHQTSCVRSQFLFYPETYQVHKSLTIVISASGIRNLHEIVPFVNIPRALAVAVLKSQFHDDSPRSLVDKRAVSIPGDAFFNWFIQTTEGSMMDFLFLRHSFASSFGCASFLQFMCQAPLQQIPSLLLSEDRKGFCIPNFLTGKHGIPHWPLADQFQHFFPKFVLNGTVATTWHVLASVIAENRDKVRVFLSAVVGKEQRKLVNWMLLRAERAAASGCPDTGHEDRPFAFVLVQHLIDVSNNAVHAQPSGLAWI
jgi:hypothetical protein